MNAAVNGDGSETNGAAPNGAAPNGAALDGAAPDAGQRDEPAIAPIETLPDPVRQRLVAWAAQVLGGLPAAQVPASLTRVARFTPAKRARMGAAALAAALGSDAAFRALVAAPLADPADSSALDATSAAADPAGGADSAEGVDGVDTVTAAARAYLLRLPEEPELMARVRAAAGSSGARSELDQLRRDLRQLDRQLRSALTELDRSRAGGTESASDEAEKLRRRLRDQGARLRAAESATAAVRTDLQSEIDRLTADLVAARDEVIRWRERSVEAAERADRAQETVARLREAGGRARTSADRRLELLLATVEGAAAGLRREWDLQGGGADPAQLVADALPAAAGLPESTADPVRLGSWLALPSAHLIVDGYNVTKTGYPDATLHQQRERLIRQLGPLAARTSAEITVVFDGAAVVVPQPPGRGVRVLFSAAGVIADDVIADLVAAEPAGRVVVVVSADREVVQRVRSRGARAAGSRALLTLLGS